MEAQASQVHADPVRRLEDDDENEETPGKFTHRHNLKDVLDLGNIKFDDQRLIMFTAVGNHNKKLKLKSVQVEGSPEMRPWALGNLK